MCFSVPVLPNCSSPSALTDFAVSSVLRKPVVDLVEAFVPAIIKKKKYSKIQRSHIPRVKETDCNNINDNNKKKLLSIDG